MSSSLAGNVITSSISTRLSHLLSTILTRIRSAPNTSLSGLSITNNAIAIFFFLARALRALVGLTRKRADRTVTAQQQARESDENDSLESLTEEHYHQTQIDDDGDDEEAVEEEVPRESTDGPWVENDPLRRVEAISEGGDDDKEADENIASDSDSDSGSSSNSSPTASSSSSSSSLQASPLFQHTVDKISSSPPSDESSSASSSLDDGDEDKDHESHPPILQETIIAYYYLAQPTPLMQYWLDRPAFFAAEVALLRESLDLACTGGEGEF